MSCKITMEKLLAIDVGNTNVKYGLFLNGELSQTWKHPTSDTAAKCAEFLAKTDAPCALACVSPEAGKLIKAALGSRLLLEVTAASQTVLADMADGMGADRVADAVAAFLLYGNGSAVISMSFGTASTLLAMDAGGKVLGGWISSGLAAQLEVMHERCALLPLLSMSKPDTALGVDTETHMSNGVLLGNIGAAREWIQTATRQLGVEKAVSVATGGWAQVLQDKGRVFDHYDSALTLKGIYEIASRKKA
ncbi:MAG: type III pantothenate kinase [Candidatus Obscuribacterales bacterium]|nr:type III pantothenate kinase [Candidatus Obscuribacterales bacterium]